MPGIRILEKKEETHRNGFKDPINASMQTCAKKTVQECTNNALAYRIAKQTRQECTHALLLHLSNRISKTPCLFELLESRLLNENTERDTGNAMRPLKET